MSVFNSIVEWGKEQEAIIKETFVRVVTKNGYTGDDVKDIATLLKEETGIKLDREITYSAFPSDLNEEPFKATNLVLKRIQNTQNVTTIKDETITPFSHEGITIIYGENGAGKSGIAKVLKQACRARKVDKVLSNVFNKEQKVSKAELVVSVNENEATFPWEDGKYSIDILSNISVFDSKCAIIQLDAKNQLYFVPQGGELFQQIVGCLGEVKELLHGEMKELKLPSLAKAYPTTTELSKIISAIDKTLEVNDFLSNIAWDEKDIEELKKSNELRGVTDEDNNKKKQAVLVQKIEKLSAIEKFLDLAETVFNEKKLNSFNELLKETKLKKKTLDALSETLKESSSLDKVGGEIWKELYLAAKKYSEECYPEKPFPNLENDSVCVLCQQPFGEKSNKRMKTFESLMEGVVKKEYDDKIVAYNKSLKFFKDNFVENYNLIIEKFNDLIVEHDKLVIDDLERVKELAAKIVEQNESLEESEILKLCFKSELLKEIRRISETASKELVEVKEIIKPEKIIALKNKIDELEQKKEVYSKKAEYQIYLENLVFNRKLNECIGKIGTTAISRTGKKIVSSYISELFLNSLKKELQQLGAKHIPLNFKTSGDAGTVNFDIGLENATIPRSIKLTEILSEGEVKVISLAVFLAEVGINPDKFPIVLDDPVTSLDHKYREKIAERLVVEGIERQVIIFTHDISFVTMIEHNCLKKQVKQHVISIRRDNEFGEIKEDSPWNTKGVSDRITFLKILTKEIQEKGLEQESYNREVGGVYGLLRESWERFVEEVLFHKVISRFGYEVKTLRLNGVEVTDEDYKKVYWGMHKCSRWMIGHDDSEPLDSSRPQVEEVLKDIEDFFSYFKTCKKRNSELNNVRNDLVKKPLTSTVG